MKRVKDGIAFRGRECYLSNFYPCELLIDKELYVSVEQYYQYIKSPTCGDNDRARKVLGTDDLLQAKILGDSCTDKDEWNQNKVYVMFKSMFYKFAQNEELAYKLFSTEKLRLYEATTDRFYRAGIGLNSEKWELNNWEGKNVAGTLLSKVWKIFKRKMDDGLTLNKLVFKYSLPRLRDDESKRHRELLGLGWGGACEQ